MSRPVVLSNTIVTGAGEIAQAHLWSGLPFLSLPRLPKIGSGWLEQFTIARNDSKDISPYFSGTGDSLLMLKP